MSYYDAVKLLQSNGWVSVKLFNDRETWSKNDKTHVIIVRDNISKQLINSILASV